ncbi:unnamed protein product [Phaedon cochleariae]|uniref:Transporter n=1 Tax=Phaedon cochleariae TaxID=80249 RepID=A0A9N9X3A5_PHACE|nr:unnamed protein product [Phaedon cochleariae]
MQPPDDLDPDRAAWSGKLQFFLSIIGYSVGLGNIWRFPYLCQQNGGGIPLFLIELGIGQKMRLGSLGVWNTIHPWLGGIGISSCVVTFFVALYYNVIITWCFYYLYALLLSSDTVVYFTSLFPYVVLTIFFVRGITLKGASAGLAHMLTPKVEKLLSPKVWLDAATQVFYSFGLAFGSLIAFGSYNTPKNNCVRDVILVSVCNAVTAIYASVVIFAILGFKATIQQSVRKLFLGSLHQWYSYTE